jgi:hypothetical protein
MRHTTLKRLGRVLRPLRTGDAIDYQLPVSLCGDKATTAMDAKCGLGFAPMRLSVACFPQRSHSQKSLESTSKVNILYTVYVLSLYTVTGLVGASLIRSTAFYERLLV